MHPFPGRGHGGCCAGRAPSFPSSSYLLSNKQNVLAVTVLCCFVVVSLSFLKQVVVDTGIASAAAARVVGAASTATAAAATATTTSKNGGATFRLPPPSDNGAGGGDDVYKHPVPELFRVSSSPSSSSPQKMLASIRDRLPVPLQVMERYVKRHSVDALREDYLADVADSGAGGGNHYRRLAERKYAVVFYSCPVQAGNRFHHYLTGMLWSILTNRTMLYKYWDEPTCLKYGRDFSQAICTSSNNATDCENIMHRAPWVASFDDWAPLLLGLGKSGGDATEEEEEPYELPFYSTHPRRIVNSRYPWGPNNNEDSFGVDVKFQDRRVVIFAQTRFKISFLSDQAVRDTLLHSDWSRRVCKQLYSLGADFLFGMMHRYSFDLSRHMKESAVQPGGGDPEAEKDAFTVALHSRHIDPELDGCDVQREEKCMTQLIQRNQLSVDDVKNGNNRRRCVVMLMSDRQCTITQMSGWLQSQGCSVQVASHESHTDYLGEHGPFAGAGFFQDLALASTARSAFVGLSRSSSDLILELIEFNRKMDSWRSNAYQISDPNDNVYKCLLAKIIPAKRIEHMEKKAQGNETTEEDVDVTDHVGETGSSVCSCMNQDAPEGCCERVVRRTHKMGFVLSRELFGHKAYPGLEVLQKFRNESTATTTDYRDVVLTRDWYDSLVSGYLYHKSGRECWLSAFGKPIVNSKSWIFNRNWETLLTWVEPRPPKADEQQSLCAYLSDNSIEEGMRVYIDAAFGRWYHKLLEDFELSQLPQDKNRTLFVCYEKLADPRTQVETAQTILRWLYPGENDQKNWGIKEPKSKEMYSGGHSTSHNVEVRDKLKEVVEHLDETVFDGLIASLNTQFGCSS